MKIRLDRLLVEKGLAQDTTKAAALIMAGQVLLKGQPVTKSGTPVDAQVEITIKPAYPYVSRGASKLEALLDRQGVDLHDMVAADIGASTGGFTDLMLQRGARRVYAIDVGHGQLHWRLRNDPRVINLEGVNVRVLDPEILPEKCDLATFDVSFISLKLVVPPVLKILKPDARIIALIKPQFEARRDQIGQGGIVRDTEVIEIVIAEMQTFFACLGLKVAGIIPSPIRGAKGNQEYLLHAVREAVQ